MKKILPIFIALITVVLISCSERQTRTTEQSKEYIWTGDKAVILSDQEIQDELATKYSLLQKYMTENNFGGVLLTQVRNVNWVTAGTVNTQIVLNKDVGAASLLFMKDGKKYLICNDSEAGRLMDAQLGKYGYELKRYNWYEANPVNDTRGKIIRDIAGAARIASDVPFPGTELLSPEFKQLRYSLMDTEIKRYKWLGEKTTEAVADVCKKIKQGMNEYEIEAMTAAELRGRGILPTVLLIAVDERISKYRHALPGGAELRSYAMINVVAEKWGMPVAVTRFVHFGELPSYLKEKLLKTAIVNAHYEEATVPGKSLAQLFEECKEWYKEAGYQNEWMNHHQGGAIGYDDREYVIYPGVKETVRNKQAFAWNPTITGTKIEDTIIAFGDSIMVITKSLDWPMINVKLNGKVYPQPGILIREPKTGNLINTPDVDVSVP